MHRFSLALQRLATGQAGGIELVFTSHARWPLPSRAGEANTSGDEQGHTAAVPDTLAVSVLDSSFNPPTMAHLALARIPQLSNLGEGAAAPPSAPRPFDAKLLLFSVKNADKVPKSGDATPAQRLEMMILLAHELAATDTRRSGASPNVAVALCQEPTFVGKSTLLTSFLSKRLADLSSPVPTQLTFLLGFDTLERLFAPKYYGDSESAMQDALRRFLSPLGDNSRVICVRRSSGASYTQTDNSVLEAAAEFIDSGAVALVDIEASESALSSSEIRENIRSASGEWEAKVPRAVAAYIKENNLYERSA